MARTMNDADRTRLGFDPTSRASWTARLDGGELSVDDGMPLFERPRARRCRPSPSSPTSCAAAQAGDVVTYVVNRNINFTNVCIKHCSFCAFSRDHREEEGYFLPIDELVRARHRGVGAGRDRGLHPGRPAAEARRRALPRPLPRDQGGAARDAHPRASRRKRSCTARRARGLLDRGVPRASSRRPGSARCPAPRPRSSTRRSATSSRAAASRSSSGSR